jgi:DNA helicase HerA-like ATPase
VASAGISVARTARVRMVVRTLPRPMAASTRPARISHRSSSMAREKSPDARVRFNAPVIVAIEEAHSFLPVDRDTDAKYMASKIAREGRKFGVSLIIISQRPSRVDQDVLSQMGSLAVSRITQPKDQSYIVESSELVTEELARYLPSLNVGEVLLLGQWVTLPSMAKVDKVEEKLLGADIDAVSEWREDAKLSTVAKERTSELIKRR